MLRRESLAAVVVPADMEGDGSFITKEWLAEALVSGGLYDAGEIREIRDLRVGPGCELGEGFVCAIFSCKCTILTTSGNSKVSNCVYNP
jgi:hypothetical protein